MVKIITEDVLDMMVGVAGGILLASSITSGELTSLIADISSKFQGPRFRNSHEIRGRLAEEDLRSHWKLNTYYATIEATNGQRQVVVYSSGIVGSETPLKLYHLFKVGDNLILRVENTEESENYHTGLSARLDKE